MTPSTHMRGTYPELALLLLVGGAIYGWIAAYDSSTMAFQDAIEYLRMADFYRLAILGEPLTHAVEYYRSTRLPPLYPLLLAAFGAGSEHQQAAAFVTAGTVLAAALAVWLWRRSESPKSREGLGIGLALLLYPQFFLISLHPVSEPLSIAIVAAAFALLAPARPEPSRLLAASLLIGLAPLARTALLPLPIAFVIWMLVQRPRSLVSIIVPTLCAWLPILAWMGYRNASGSDSYLAYLDAESLATRIGPWPDALWIQPRRLFEAWASNWGDPTNSVVIAAAWIIGGLGLVGSLLRLRENRLDAWFLGGYILLIVVWPFPFELPRFLVIVYPIILVCALRGMRALLAKRPRVLPWAPAILVCAVTVASFPTAWRYLNRAMLPVEPELLGDKREIPFFRIKDDQRALIAAEVFARMRILSEESGKLIPASECVYSVHPELQSLYGRARAVRYPLDLANSSPEEARQRLRECDWFIVAGFDTAEPALPALYPFRTLQGWTKPVLSSTFKSGQANVPAGLLLRRIPQDEQPKDK